MDWEEVIVLLVYIRCINCGREFEGEPKYAFKAWEEHLPDCKPIREIWCWETIRQRVMARDGYRCVDCGGKEELEVHHIVPLAEGGTNTPDNLITLCKRCHRRRTREFMKRRMKHRKHKRVKRNWG